MQDCPWATNIVYPTLVNRVWRSKQKSFLAPLAEFNLPLKFQNRGAASGRGNKLPMEIWDWLLIYWFEFFQLDYNRKRDAELQKLQHEVEELQLQNETQLGAFRKKHQELQNEFADQIDQLHKAKQKY